ncbi:MAG: hypothetical protein LBU85_07315 [Treponema sp.]|nr:hypothetical protein [Treponema sp.]
MKTRIALLCAAAVVLNSCLGVRAGIVIKADGSGKLSLEYRVSQELESLGRLDGNESRPAVPVGKADFERTAARIPGLMLSQYSSRDVPNSSGGRDLVTKVTLDFKDSGALLAFLDGAGSSAALVEDGSGKLLRLVFLEPSGGVTNPDLLSLLREISGAYELDLSFSLPKNADITTIPASIPAAKLVSNGKKASFSIGMGDLLSLNEGLVLEIRW